MKRQLWEAPCPSLGEAITLANAEMVKSLRREDVQEDVAVPLKHTLKRIPGFERHSLLV